MRFFAQICATVCKKEVLFDVPVVVKPIQFAFHFGVGNVVYRSEKFLRGSGGLFKGVAFFVGKCVPFLFLFLRIVFVARKQVLRQIHYRGVADHLDYRTEFIIAELSLEEIFPSESRMFLVSSERNPVKSGFGVCWGVFCVLESICHARNNNATVDKFTAKHLL